MCIRFFFANFFSHQKTEFAKNTITSCFSRAKNCKKQFDELFSLMEKHGNSLRLEVTLFSSYSTYLDEQDIWHDMKKNINIFMLHKSLIYIEKHVLPKLNIRRFENEHECPSLYVHAVKLDLLIKELMSIFSTNTQTAMLSLEKKISNKLTSKLELMRCNRNKTRLHITKLFFFLQRYLQLLNHVILQKL